MYWAEDCPVGRHFPFADAIGDEPEFDAKGSDPFIGHHLKVLKDAGLIRVARREAEEHGRLQKFYQSNAIIYIVESHNMSKEIDHYFMPISRERVRRITASASVVLGAFAIRIH